jgi:hypothetical protein
VNTNDMVNFDPLWLWFCFCALVLPVVALNMRTLFTHRHARRHRLLGLSYLLFLAVYVLSIEHRESELALLVVDALFGVLGCLLTLSAAFDFKKQHSRVDNHGRSGTLDDTATVTYAEMIEHAFYQIVNCVNVLCLHAFSHVDRVSLRCALCVLATSVWLLRDRFPVHSFMANYSGQPLTVTNVLYRLKKWQYVFLKHCLLHGLNVSAVFSAANLPVSRNFRLYWLALNASYTFEFFLQTLVKRRLLAQGNMILMQQVLMLFATLTSLRVVVDSVLPLAAATSLALNMLNRKHDVVNTVVVLGVVWAFQ